MRKLLVSIMVIASFAACKQNEATEWAPAGDHIRTAWADEIDPANVHPEYPRPQLVRRTWKSLNGLWDYAIVPKETEYPEAPDGKILVPFCVESSLSGVGKRVTEADALWYRCDFDVPRSWKGRVMLNFGAVDWHTEAWLNGEFIGSHTGGYTSFSFDITPYINKGHQRLVLKVLDGTDNGEQPRGKQVSNPGGIWYTPVTGIWQSVWIENVSKVFLKDYNAVWKGGSLTLSALVDGQADEVRVRVLEGGEGYDPETGRPGACVGETSIVPGSVSTVAISSPQLWSPEHPYLYALEFKVYAGGKLMEKVKGYTALREVAEVRDSAGNRRIGLNGEPYFQFGPLDQGWWPDGLYTAPSDDALRFDIEKTREFGFNMIRKHIKVEPARWYTWCDRLGIVVWQDMPSLAANLPGGQWGEWGYETGWDYPLTETAKDTYYKEWGEIIAQLKKYPSIVVWVPFNEAWSQFDTGKAVDFTRKQDPTRLINSASGGNSYHVGDILDSHNYPNPRMKFRSGGTQIDVLGEYGGIGLAVDGHMWQSRGSWGYQGLCSSPEEVLERYTAFAEEFIPDVESGVAAGVYTQTTDVEVEVNGLMTYDRKVIKMDVEKLRAVNQRIISAAK